MDLSRSVRQSRTRVPIRGRAASGEIDLGVVEFEVAAAFAAFDVAFAATDDHRGADFGGDVAAEVRNGGDVAAFLDHRGEERTAEQTAHPLHIHRAHTGDLAPFTVDRVAPHERGLVDHDIHRVLDAFRGAVTEHQVDERVSHVGLARFPGTITRPFPEDPVSLGIEHDLDRPADLRRELPPAAGHPVVARPRAHFPRLMLAFGACVGVVVVGLDLLASVLQGPLAQLRRSQQPFLRTRIGGGGLRDQFRLTSRQPAIAYRRVHSR
jgi:hypothetical protein